MEDIVSFEVAKLLQKHNFAEKVEYTYEMRNPNRIIKHKNLTPRVEDCVGWYGAPTIFQTTNWLSIKYHYVFVLTRNTIRVLKKRVNNPSYDELLIRDYSNLSDEFDLIFKELLTL